jgi:hypothetical protein
MKRFSALLILGVAALSSAAQDAYSLFEIDASMLARQKAEYEAKFPLGPTPTICATNRFERDLDEMDRLIKQGNTNVAAGYGKVIADNAAACALALRHEPIKGDVRRWAYYAGEGLATGLLHQSGNANEQTEARAKAYLAIAVPGGYNRAANTLEQLKRLSQPENAAAQAHAVFTSQAAVDDLVANSLAFWRKYDGKTIAVRGPVLLVSGDAKAATVSIDGRPKGVSNDEMSLWHAVTCEVSGDKQLDAAAALKKGANTKVTGVARKGIGGAITLRACSIS